MDRRRYSLRFTIATLVVGLLLTTVAGVLVVGSLVRNRAIASTAQLLQREISARITERIIERFRPLDSLLRASRDAAEAGDISLTDDGLLALFTARLRYEKRVEWLAFIRPDGSAVGAVHTEGGLLLVRKPVDDVVTVSLLSPDGTTTPAPTMDLSSLQQVPWFDLASESDEPIWTPPYTRPTDGTPGRATAIAIRKDGTLDGVLGLGFGVAFLRPYFAGIRVGETGGVFGINAETGAVSLFPTEEARERLEPAIQKAIAQAPTALADLPLGEIHSVGVRVDGTDYRVGISRQAPDKLPMWVHAVVVPEDELVGYFDDYMAAGLLAIGTLLVLSIAFAAWLARRVARSLKTIAVDLEQVGSFQLADGPPVRSMIEEVAVVGDATERMKASLRSFGRYVPTDLVRDLLSQGQEAQLGGVERPLTVFFSDIAGFTGLSEGMAPQAVVDALGDYLDVVCGAVETHRGTIDKFIGDGVLAFFNAPRDDEQHVVSACRAALAVQTALAAAIPTWKAKGWPPFFTRIGLHTADVVVGNIGTHERFAYTVIGDGVNLAARLEALNKAYGTWILVSEDVREAAGDDFVWRRIDRTAVVGRKEGSTVFELLGAVGDVDPDAVEAAAAYERALDLYLERRFAEAASAFTALAEAQPDDKAAGALAERAAMYAASPPPSDWNGVFVQTRK